MASRSSAADIVSTVTVPVKGAGRSVVSQIYAGAMRNSVTLYDHDQPVSLEMVARQIALPSGVGCTMP